MIGSVQPIQSSRANLNRIGFAAEKKESVQPKVTLETPKDDFVKIKKDQVVKVGAGIGAVVGIGRFITGWGSIPGIAIMAGVGAGVGAVVKHFSKKD